jgi:phosphatidate cytidylyltransferase
LAAPWPVTLLPPGKRFDWTNLGVRILSAVVLVPAVLFAVWTGSWFFLVLISVAVALLAIEWGGMTAPQATVRVSAAVTAAVLAGTLITYQGHVHLGWAAAAAGALGAAAIARGVSERPSDAVLGVIYIGIPCLCLVWLHTTRQGAWWTTMLLAITWSADIGAYAVGNLLKGPKLWPRISPNKTWSGFAGGLATAMIAGVAVVFVPAALAFRTPFQLNLAAAALVGVLGGLATMGGDLWESVLKRRFGVKDSGDLIPGHGGLLDRVDGLMFAVVVVAVARWVNERGWGH